MIFLFVSHHVSSKNLFGISIQLEENLIIKLKNNCFMLSQAFTHSFTHTLSHTLKLSQAITSYHKPLALSRSFCAFWAMASQCVAIVGGYAARRQCSRTGKVTVRDGRCFCAQHAKPFETAPFCEMCQGYWRLETLPCGHQFCYACLTKRGRTENNPTCPTCMEEFDPWYDVRNMGDVFREIDEDLSREEQ